MNAQLATAIIAVVGFIGNALWSYFNARWEKRTLEHIDSLKEWIRANYYDRSFLDERTRQITERLERAGA